MSLVVVHQQRLLFIRFFSMTPDHSKVYQSILFICTGFIVLHLIFGHQAWIYASASIGILSLLSFKLASLIYALWQGIGKVLGFINSKIILSLIYAVVVRPVACWYRCSKQKTMQLKNQSTSMWVDRDHHYHKDDLKNLW